MCSRLEHRLPPPVSGDTECRKPSGDEGGMGWSSAEKGISSADLCSVSPTCRARGNRFSILQRPGFLSNSLLFLLCVYLAPSVTRFPCCALLHCSLLPLHLLVANRDQISLEVTRDSFETHNEYTVLFSCRTQTFTSLQT